MSGRPPISHGPTLDLRPRAWLTWLLAIVVAVLILVAGFAYWGAPGPPYPHGNICRNYLWLQAAGGNPRGQRLAPLGSH